MNSEINTTLYFNLLFSYSAKEDRIASAAGHKFLGAGSDDKGNEVHVFQVVPIEAHQAANGVAPEDGATPED